MTVADREVPLTATEYELLRVLSVNAGRLMTYDDLLRQGLAPAPLGQLRAGAHSREDPASYRGIERCR